MRVGNLDSSTGRSVGRSALAAFLLATAIAGRYIHELPLVSG